MDGQMPRGVIFDLDGVIINTEKYHQQSWHDLGERYNIKVTPDFFKSTFGMQNSDIIPKLFKNKLNQSRIEEMADFKEQKYRELINGKMTLLEGVEELISSLKANGYKLAIGSSTPKVNLDFMLTQLSIGHFFDAFATSEDAANSKPAPDTFLAAAKKLELNPARCVVIEDAVHGVTAAVNAKMKVIAVTNTKPACELSQADRIVDSLIELTARDFDALLEL